MATVLNDYTTEGQRKCLRQQSKYFYAVNFDALVERWDNCVAVAGGYVEKYMFFRFEYLMFYVLYMFLAYFLTLPHIMLTGY
jgi:hypothetical protein